MRANTKKLNFTVCTEFIIFAALTIDIRDYNFKYNNQIVARFF